MICFPILILGDQTYFVGLSVKFDNAHNHTDTDLCDDGSPAYTNVSTDAHDTVGICQ